ncbi:TPA: hypothetical protein HA317_00010 [Candidatus Woesearchaeota archaeon]|nr:hypothetical protein [Candidatus Woesearchaeota archaeon]
MHHIAIMKKSWGLTRKILTGEKRIESRWYKSRCPPWDKNRYAEDDGIERDKIPYFFSRFRDKNYCILIFLKNPQEVKPFDIDKAGYGAMAAWMVAENLDRIKRLIT